MQSARERANSVDPGEVSHRNERIASWQAAANEWREDCALWVEANPEA